MYLAILKTSVLSDWCLSLQSPQSPPPFFLKHLQAFLHGYPLTLLCYTSSSGLTEYWISQLTTLKKELYFRVERGPHMWPIISISTCLPFSNSYYLLIGCCLAEGVFNSCHIRMGSLSYSRLQFGALIKRSLLYIGTPPPSLFLYPGIIIQHSKVITGFELRTESVKLLP